MLKQVIEPKTGRCPQCEEPVSIGAKRCPHCTSDLSEDPEWLEQQNAQANAGCASLVAFALLVGVLIAASFA